MTNAEITITRADRVVRKMRDKEDYVVFSNPPEDETDVPVSIWLDRETYEGLGEPSVITATIVAGDRLNDETADRGEYPKLPKGRCVVCGGFTPADDSIICGMCEAQGQDPDHHYRLKYGHHPDFITSTHGLTVDDLPYENGWYTLPDGSKARKHEVEQALQNWRDNNVGVVQEEAIETPLG